MQRSQHISQSDPNDALLLFGPKKQNKTLNPEQPSTRSASHLVRQHHLAVLHVFEDVVRRVQRAHLGALRPDEGGQVDEPEAVTVTQQALGPHVRHRRVLLSSLLGQLDLLEHQARHKGATCEIWPPAEFIRNKTNITVYKKLHIITVEQQRQQQQQGF